MFPRSIKVGFGSLNIQAWELTVFNGFMYVHDKAGIFFNLHFHIALLFLAVIINSQPSSQEPCHLTEQTHSS